ncbi:MAG TPA: insulinase family protein, partial [Pyrinomonadaceae bacterium]|nr:insulinase family protein [Pyrinomonadaceae bacterium]
MKNTNRLQTFAFASLIAIILSFSAAAFSQSLPAPKEEKLLNGLKVLMWNDVKTDKVSVKIRIHAGAAFDPQGKEGTMQLLADDLFPNDAVRESFAEDFGGSLDVVTTYDYIQINASSKPESLLTMLETLATAISNPTIDKDTTTKIRTALLAKLKVLEADPAYVADQAVAKRLFGTF